MLKNTISISVETIRPRTSFDYPKGWLECVVIDDFELEAKMSKPMVRPEWIAGDLAGLVCGGYLG